MDHVHESSWIMILPLLPLAIGAIFAGWYAFPWFGGEGRTEFWGKAIVVLAGHDSIGATENIPSFERWFPLAVAVPGIFFAYVCYMWAPEVPGKIARALGPIYRLVFNKYYFDQIYNSVFVRSARLLGEIFWKGGDDGIIDAYGPDGMAALTMRLAQRMSALETGYLYHYAFAMVIGVAAFVTWFWIKS
jgi:NADH-quinone oxidoreductase subunit L